MLSVHSTEQVDAALLVTPYCDCRHTWVPAIKNNSEHTKSSSYFLLRTRPVAYLPRPVAVVECYCSASDERASCRNELDSGATGKPPGIVHSEKSWKIIGARFSPLTVNPSCIINGQNPPPGLTVRLRRNRRIPRSRSICGFSEEMDCSS